jgi:hypothetical protein
LGHRVVRVQNQGKSNALSTKGSEHEGTLNFCRKCLKVIDEFRSFWYGLVGKIIKFVKKILKIQAIDTTRVFIIEEEKEERL